MAENRRYDRAVFFVYRSHHEGPLGKLVRRLPDESVLAWFQRNWRTEDPESMLEKELGADVYGLDSIFEAAADLPVPASTEELREALHEHLYVEGEADEYIRLDDYSLRVRTDDDEVELAYYFFDDTVIAESPRRLAYLLHENWPLPDTTAALPVKFTPHVPVRQAGRAGQDEVSTYAVLLTCYDGASLARTTPWVFPGVGLSELAAHLRAARPKADWDPELLVLRKLIEPDDDSIGPALERCNLWPGFNLNETPWPGPPRDHELTQGRQPGLSRVHVSDHLAQLAMHTNEFFGYQQWYLFDSVWAATHPNLAQSLLRYAGHWDPLLP